MRRVLSPRRSRLSVLLLLVFSASSLVQVWNVAAQADGETAGENLGVLKSMSLGPKDLTQLIIDQVALQLGDLQGKYQNLLLDFNTYKAQHRNDLETLERRLRDDYAEDMGGMELWMRQEHGHAIQELKLQHQAALVAQETRMRQEHEVAIVLLRNELLEQVNQHAQAVQDLSGKVHENMAIWTSVVEARIQASNRSEANSAGDNGSANTESRVTSTRRLRPGSGP